ncbi:MAG: 50S ribosomal protein L15 [Deltaproteobacteria bacterium]|nr:MAG: 50S ribosomal protein L15 [Deltaproteobacteria bacterium]PIE75271.1 MAG: 50S ribosomal protein L15 [Deltaproteobacteria bacterium]
MRLHELSPAENSRKKRKRKGRGPGSGNGKTAGRGYKGAKSRSGGRVKPGFEGGQMPLQRRLPKRGFTNIFRREFSVINLSDLAGFAPDTEIDESLLVNSGKVRKLGAGVKVLGNGEIKVPLTIKVSKASKSAIEKIESAGGRIEVILK